MDNFVVSARKYRPLGFDEVVGQDHITTTLKNAVAQQKVSQAMLFCGPRGVGKTTCARIVARLINQFDERIDGAGTFNIFELDAASNNSVEDIRRLVEQVRFPPQQGKYKVYIIDEVHMLSTAAFNAFLKTLEEPPGYAIFILATTEKHKVLPTILSRCQIFDFNRIQIANIAAQLQKIADLEQIKTEPEALHLIAQKADGALRDALSIFDLMVTYSNNNAVAYADVLRNLHILDYDYYFKIIKGLLSQNHTEPLLIFDEILRKGFDGSHFVSGLAEHLRNLLVSQDARTVKLMDVPETIRQKYHEQAKSLSSELILVWISLLNQCDVQYKGSKNQRLLVELYLMKMAHTDLLPSTEETELEPPQKKNDIEKKAPPVLVTSPPVETPSPVLPKNQASQATFPPTNQPPAAAPLNRAPSLMTNTPNISPPPAEKKENKPPVGVPLDRAPSLTLNIQAISPQPTEKREKKSPAPLSKESSKPDAPIEAAALQQAWHAYAERQKQMPIRYMLFRQPYVLNENIITLSITNEAQRPILQEIKEDLLTYLRDALQCNDISIKAELTENDHGKIAAYTNTDKFAQMANKNPALRELKTTLGLDAEF